MEQSFLATKKKLTAKASNKQSKCPCKNRLCSDDVTKLLTSLILELNKRLIKVGRNDLIPGYPDNKSSALNKNNKKVQCHISARPRHPIMMLMGSRDGAVVEHLSPTQASHQCGPGSIPGLGVKCGLSLLLVLVLAPRGFSPGSPVFPSPQKPTFPNSNSIWNPRATGLSVISLLSVTLVK